MNRVEAVKQAFIEAYSGYREARDDILDATDYPDTFSLCALAPVAAEIYRQLTGRLLVTAGSGEKPARIRDVQHVGDMLEEVGRREYIIPSQGVQFRELDNETVIRIVVEVPGGEVTDGGEA